MSSNKAYNLAPYPNIPLQAVSANITAIPTNIYGKDNINLQFLWTGTLSGTFDVQVSTDYSKDTGQGTWDSLPLTPGPAATGSAGHWTVDLNELSSPWLRVVFTYTSGTGNLTSTICGKAL